MAADDRRSFGTVLKRLRLAAGLTHEALAERSGVSPRTISDLERGVSRFPRADTVALLGEALSVSPQQRATLVAAAQARGTPADAYDAAHGIGSIPVQLTSFVGRQREVQAVQDLLKRRDTRLVTLTGPGGAGKTRLAVRVAEELYAAYADGARYVALATVAERDGVALAIARALDMTRTERSVSMASVIDTLRSRELLLVLDNFEHLLDAAPSLVDLLRGCPRLDVLVTSRAALRVSGEQEAPVAPLPTPEVARLPPLERLADYAAVTLFVERAARVVPGFRLSDDNAAAVAEICVRLDGLPLAIELAAARTKILPPAALLARLSDGPAGAALRLLTTGARDLPARQRTLRHTMDWSYTLLSPSEQRLFRQLSVFAGGCTLEAAEAICAPRPTAEATPAAQSGAACTFLDSLASLVDNSLIFHGEGPDGAPRLLMLETIREFALERLVAHAEDEELRGRHAEYYLAVMKATGALLFATRHDRLRAAAEQDNTLAALHWWMRHG